jgi:hypothetical protein
MASALPPLMHMMRDIGGVDMQEFFAKLRDPDNKKGDAQSKDGSGGDGGKSTAVTTPPPKKKAGE